MGHVQNRASCKLDTYSDAGHSWDIGRKVPDESGTSSLEGNLMKRIVGASAGFLIVVGAVAPIGNVVLGGTWEWPQEAVASTWEWPQQVSL